MPNRKHFLKQLGTGMLATGIPAWASAEDIHAAIDINDFTDEGAADDEKYWNRIAKKYYHVADDYTNLENGYYGIQPKPVLEAFLKNVSYANEQGARFARKIYPDTYTTVKKELAAFLSVADEEILITRNATEALNIAIQGYPFKPGDEVLICQLDYFSTIEAFRMLEKRGRIKVNTFDMPLLPSSEEEIVQKYSDAITAKTRLILLTHVSNITGLVVPVAKIAAMARQKGIDIICDSAHALGQIPFSLPALGCDYVGMNLHKWIGNPIGAGVLYVRKERIPGMSSLFGDITAAEKSITKLGHFGTTPFGVIMTIPTSIAFHKMMGVERISKRLHHLKALWLNEFKNDAVVEIVTPADENLSCALAAFRIKNKKSAEVADRLLKEHNILTVRRVMGNEDCIRVTPAVYNSAADVEKLVTGIKSIKL